MEGIRNVNFQACEEIESNRRFKFENKTDSVFTFKDYLINFPVRWIHKKKGMKNNEN